MIKYKLNVPKTSLGSFRHYWRGIPKIGKTSLFRDLVIEAYGDPKHGLLIAPGNETGFSSLSNLYPVEAPDWNTFVEHIDDLVENKSENEFKIIAIDTVDELVSIATEKVLKIHFQRKGEKCHSLNAALGGFGQGHTMVQKLINDQIRRLEAAGYGLVFISHTKIREIKEKNMDSAYMQLTSNMESRFDKIFSDKADIIATMYIEKNVQDSELVSTERYIYFRSDGFVDAGTRFPNIPERVPLSAKEYLKAFKIGVMSAFDNKVTDKELKRLQEQELKEKEEKAAEYVEKAKTGDVEHAAELQTSDDYRKLIDEKLSELDKETKNQKRAEVKEKGLPTNLKTIEDVEVLKQILKVISN